MSPFGQKRALNFRRGGGNAERGRGKASERRSPSDEPGSGLSLPRILLWLRERLRFPCPGLGIPDVVQKLFTRRQNGALPDVDPVVLVGE